MTVGDDPMLCSASASTAIRVRANDQPSFGLGPGHDDVAPRAARAAPLRDSESVPSALRQASSVLWRVSPSANMRSMSANSSPLPRFRRAIEVGSVLQAEAAARELGSLDLDDALRLLLLLHRERDERYERAAVRFLGRVLSERPGIGFTLADTLLDGLSELDGPAADVARSRIALALRGAHLAHAADYVAKAKDLTT